MSHVPAGPSPRADRSSAAATKSNSSRSLVLVLAWNGYALTEACIESLLRMAGSFDVLVVDNASSDGTAAALRARFGARIAVLENTSNLLFAGGMNVGLQHALDQGYEDVLLMNNDVVVDAGLLKELKAVSSSDARIAAVGPKIYYFDSQNVLWFAGGEMSLWRGWPRHRGLREIDAGQYDAIRDVDYLTGCAFLVRRAALVDVGLFDPGYAMYAEDADWCFRAHEKGWRLVYAPGARMWHRVSASAGAHSWFKIRRRVASQWRFLRRHARWYHALTIPFGTIVEALRVGRVLGGR